MAIAITRYVEWTDISQQDGEALLAASLTSLSDLRCNSKHATGSGRGFFICTSKQFHAGPHVATTGIKFCAAWPNEREDADSGDEHVEGGA